MFLFAVRRISVTIEYNIVITSTSTNCICNVSVVVKRTICLEAYK